ncbi:MAG TPA: cupin domain-containing protein [Anaerolineaceae bacterium]
MREPSQITPAELIRRFDLQPLPVEGGLFAQTYLSAEEIPAAYLPARYGSNRPFGTAIVYLLTPDADSFSALHRLPTDEVYHFYLGDPVEMLLLFPDGISRNVTLGQDLLGGDEVQFTVPRGVWQGSHLKAGGAWALVGTTMAPGYANADYEGGRREDLLLAYPAEADLIRRLTRE